MPEGTKTYWLIREKGKDHGFATVSLDDAITADAAVDCCLTTMEPEMRELFRMYGTDENLEAVLATLRYIDGEPVISIHKEDA